MLTHCAFILYNPTGIQGCPTHFPIMSSETLLFWSIWELTWEVPILDRWSYGVCGKIRLQNKALQGLGKTGDACDPPVEEMTSPYQAGVVRLNLRDRIKQTPRRLPEVYVFNKTLWFVTLLNFSFSNSWLVALCYHGRTESLVKGLTPFSSDTILSHAILQEPTSQLPLRCRT